MPFLSQGSIQRDAAAAPAGFTSANTGLGTLDRDLVRVPMSITSSPLRSSLLRRGNLSENAVCDSCLWHTSKYADGKRCCLARQRGTGAHHGRAASRQNPRTVGCPLPCRARLGLWTCRREIHLLDGARTSAFKHGDRVLPTRLRPFRPLGDCLLVGRTHRDRNG
jgi:hypothetical protein